ncbi:hypothetical protein [Saccharothrix sp. ST-888]|uniref:hypothetical protein n=1 Tax=Saccharothrix sp. ST-888 TaxID=1427391 RepID=UPI0005EBFD41|nr:hypothetical protein [Saccharothrix sp. ST-888]KJK58401.1 hypothetical protein UK12_10835 [Saccharothrix sp. ST-888]
MTASQFTGSRLRKAGVRAAGVCAAALIAVGLSGAEAMALDSGTTAATFTLAQPDWYANTSSSSSNVTLELWGDGNLVLHTVSDTDGGIPLWASGTSGRGVTHVDWSRAGYAKLLDASNNVVCTLGKLNPAPGGTVRVQDDGNVVFYDTNGNATWSTGTYNGPGNLNYCYT